jgi:hypothetical protein
MYITGNIRILSIKLSKIQFSFIRVLRNALPGLSVGRDTYFAVCRNTAIPIIIEGRFQVFQKISSSKMVLKTVESCFVALNYYGNGSTGEILAVCRNTSCCVSRHFLKK